MKATKAPPENERNNFMIFFLFLCGAFLNDKQNTNDWWRSLNCLLQFYPVGDSSLNVARC